MRMVPTGIRFIIRRRRISDYLNRNDWPGMPARSFVDKWGGGPTGQREADQVAWNLVSLGSFAAGDYTGSAASSHYYELANRTHPR